MEANKIQTFQSLSENVGRFSLKDKTLLIPEMNRIGSHLLAGTFKSFGVNALTMETYKGIQLGKEFTSGKECYPCQVTLGDILLFMKKEKERLGNAFDPERYVYFMPEAGGPCRFGMYNKYQRIVLDSFPELRTLKIGSLTTDNSYSLEGMIEKGETRNFRKAAYFSVVVGDVLDRLLWRIRPYERDPGSADSFIEKAMRTMSRAFETHGSERAFDKILDDLEQVIQEGKSLIDPTIPPKPKIGMVGEIYLRTHTPSNQDVIRLLEQYGAEVVNASIAEWINFTTYENKRNALLGLRLSLKQFRLKQAKMYLKEVLSHGIDLRYQEYRQNQVYRRAASLVDLPRDHQLAHLENVLKEKDIFSFDIGTEACLSIAGIMEYIREGYNGVVNVYPFTCMPSTITSAVIKPMVTRANVPYLDTPYDGSFQPGREAAIRTFMYQAEQHLRRNRRRDSKVYDN